MQHKVLYIANKMKMKKTPLSEWCAVLNLIESILDAGGNDVKSVFSTALCRVNVRSSIVAHSLRKVQPYKATQRLWTVETDNASLSFSHKQHTQIILKQITGHCIRIIELLPWGSWLCLEKGSNSGGLHVICYLLLNQMRHEAPKVNWKMSVEFSLK